MTERSSRERIVRRAAAELRDGSYVNLGIGLPSEVADHVPPDIRVIFHTENGMLGVGRMPPPGEEDPDLVNASKLPVTPTEGCSYFDSADSFAMIRGGHIDLTVLGALEVDERGNLANWTVPGRLVKGMGGAMDLVTGARRVIVVMTHRTRDGGPKILRRCRLPLTGAGVVDRIITDLAVIDAGAGGLTLREIAPGITIEQVVDATEGRLAIDPEGVRPMEPA